MKEPVLKDDIITAIHDGSGSFISWARGAFWSYGNTEVGSTSSTLEEIRQYCPYLFLQFEIGIYIPILKSVGCYMFWIGE